MGVYCLVDPKWLWTYFSPALPRKGPGGLSSKKFRETAIGGNWWNISPTLLAHLPRGTIQQKPNYLRDSFLNWDQYLLLLQATLLFDLRTLSTVAFVIITLYSVLSHLFISRPAISFGLGDYTDPDLDWRLADLLAPARQIPARQARLVDKQPSMSRRPFNLLTYRTYLTF